MAVEITVVTSAEVVGSVDDLLIQILLPLPVKSLMRFKLVSKDWRSLITSHRLSLLRNTGPNPAVGLFFRGRKFTDFEYIHLGARNQTKGPFRELRFPDDPFPFWIQQSCNGLLLCCSSEKRRRDSEFASQLFQIEVYSSESGAWRVSGEPFDSSASFQHGVYWNGSVHWISEETEEILYFNLDKETFGTILWPSAVDGYGPMGEMLRDYSEWFVKYRVDRTAVAAAFPQIHYGDFSVFSLVRGKDGCSCLLLRTPSKIVRVNLDCDTFEEIVYSRDALFRPSLPHAFEYIESLACV
ncbi:F-box protein [Sesamum angolense]|uniref:F-box protein n=1 Tax=Sesamum angolense TaxID=2727404 RepID=A0AAE2BGX0_9LAMI|nr:F-box protein [Sesamum angolense]